MKSILVMALLISFNPPKEAVIIIDYRDAGTCGYIKDRVIEAYGGFMKDGTHRLEGVECMTSEEAAVVRDGR